jgi:cardiolipin synthase
MLATECTNFQFHRTGDEAFAAMLAAMDSAQKSIRFETYIYSESPIGDTFRTACINACNRGVRVHVLVDAAGSLELSDDYWEPLRQAGGRFRWFNRLQLDRFAIRNHRKILVCDDDTGFVGGYNIAPEYEGDGVVRGWCDHGLMVRGELAHRLSHAFDTSFARAEFRPKRFLRLRKTSLKEVLHCPDGEVLLGGPGLGKNPIQQRLRADLQTARNVRIVSASFLPPWSIRRELARVVRRGGSVQLILAGKSDVALSQLACRNLYSGLLRAGIEIYEYQPQILHAKLLIIDDVVYAGSANIDTRSLSINYEIMVRMSQPAPAAEARKIFEADLQHSLRIQRSTWRKSRNFWAKLKERWAHFLVARVDPYIALKQFRSLR